jgi:hypothetical protein
VSDRPNLALPLLPETLVRHRTTDGSGERLEFEAYLDDRLAGGGGTTSSTISTLSALGEDVGELHWGNRRFPVRLADLRITETAFHEDLEPIAATIRLALEVLPAEAPAVSVTVAGERWRLVPDLHKAGPNDPVYEVRQEENGSLSLRFGDGKHGARPPSGEIQVRARYRVGGGRAGR